MTAHKRFIQYILNHRYTTNWLNCLVLLVCSMPALAETQVSSTPLPDPLSLQFAIQQGTYSGHPAMRAAEADQYVAEAVRESADSNYAFESNIHLIAGYVDPNDVALNQSNDDNSASINARKTLYDFGVTGGKVDSADSLIAASRIEYELARQRQVVSIAQRYFDVLLADLKYAWDNEAMAMQYVQYDRAQEKHILKQVSDVELLQKESDYQIARTQRFASETMQRTNRELLAVAMNRPGELSADLQEPLLDIESRSLAGLDELVDTALKRNIMLDALRKRETSARLALEASSKRFRPTLDATFEASEYSRNTPSKDDMRARLNLVIPLTEDGSQRSEVAEHRAAWLQSSANVLQYENLLRKQLAELWQQIQQLQIQAEELKVTAARVEIELDKARGEYELEIRSDLGDAMVNTSLVRYKQAKNRYQLALAWMQINILTGDDPFSIIRQDISNGEKIR